MIDFKELIQAGVHFGHQKTRGCPKMAPYIWGHRSGVQLIDVSKTAHNLEKAMRFLENTATNNKQILWVGTKPAAQEIVKNVAAKLNMPYVNHRWVGGMLTNFSQVKKSVTKLLHYEDILKKSEDYQYTKKELNKIQKTVEKLKKTVEGIRGLSWPIGAVVVVDVKKEITAIKEADQMGIPVVALVDTNGDPSLVDYVIPANDDSPKSIKLVIDYLAQAAEKGKEEAAEKKKADKIAREEAAELEAKSEGVEIAFDLEEDEEEEGKSKTAKKKVAVKTEPKKKPMPAKRKPSPRGSRSADSE